MKLTAIDLDSMIHIVAAVQFKSGNRTNINQVKEHVRRFYATIRTNSQCENSIAFYQVAGHTNYRNDILPEYKGHRVPSEAIILWKPVIIDAFKELGAVGLQHIESDDMVNALAHYLDGEILIISSDKDMKQTPGNHYNPFKAKIKEEDRWFNVTHYEAEKFLYQQVLSGDPTDMPGELCGIEGVGEKTAIKLLESSKIYMETINIAYTEKYADKGFNRANLTYKMVRLLNGTSADNYAGEKAIAELQGILHTYPDYVKDIKDDVGALFGVKSTSTSDLFNN